MPGILIVFFCIILVLVLSNFIPLLILWWWLLLLFMFKICFLLLWQQHQNTANHSVSTTTKKCTTVFSYVSLSLFYFCVHAHTHAAPTLPFAFQMVSYDSVSIDQTGSHIYTNIESINSMPFILCHECTMTLWLPVREHILLLLLCFYFFLQTNQWKYFVRFSSLSRSLLNSKSICLASRPGRPTTFFRPSIVRKSVECRLYSI